MDWRYAPLLYLGGFALICLIFYISYVVRGTYKGVFYGSAKKSKSEYKLVKVELTRIKTVRITIHEEYGLRTVEGYTQRAYIKSPILSSWKTKTKTYFKSIPIQDCTLLSLQRHSDPDIKSLAEQIYNTICSEIGNPETFAPANGEFSPAQKTTSDWLEQQQIQAMIYKFWRDADNLIMKYGAQKDAESIFELMVNIWQTRDKRESAVDLHFRTLNAIAQIYPLRSENEEAVDMTLQLCELDISNFDNLKLEMDISDLSLITPHKKAVILEKRKQYCEALEFAEWCLENNIPESKGKSFADRIERLKKKLY